MIKRMIIGLFIVLAMPLYAQSPVAQKQILSQVQFGQNLRAQIPLNLPFRDETGRTVTLADYFHGKPVILSLVYYQCPMLCTESLNGLLRAIRSISLNAGQQYAIVTISFDPRESTSLAAAKKKTYVERYGRRGAERGWAFLTGDESSIRPLTDAVGFHYAYDPTIHQYAHPTGIMVLTPSGKIAQYLYGVEYSARDLRLALVEASSERIGSTVDRLLLYCYQYDPLSGKYNVAILRVVRAGGLATVVSLAFFILFYLRRERHALSV